MGPLQIDNWSVMGLPREILGLSPSLFSSPEKLLPEKILEDGDEYLTQGERPGLGLMLGSFRKHTVMPLKCAAPCWAMRDTQGCIPSRPCRKEPTAWLGGSPRPVWAVGGSRSLEQGPARSAQVGGAPWELGWELDLDMALEIQKPREQHSG